MLRGNHLFSSPLTLRQYYTFNLFPVYFCLFVDSVLVLTKSSRNIKILVFIQYFLKKLKLNFWIFTIDRFQILGQKFITHNGNFTPQVKEARNQSQIFNRKSISRNTTHRQSYHLQAVLTGVKR